VSAAANESSDQQRQLGYVLTYELTRLANLVTTAPTAVLLIADVRTSASVLANALESAMRRAERGGFDGQRRGEDP